MRAVGYKAPLPIAAADLDIEISADVKVRASTRPEGGGYKILGWDAASIVRESGADCSLFKPGDEVCATQGPLPARVQTPSFILSMSAS